MLEPVDMGLPSGLLWSAVEIDITQPGNVSATPFTYRKSFFSWGNVEGHNPIPGRAEFAYNWGTVRGASPYYEGMVYGTTPGAALAIDIPPAMDAARIFLGSPWRMPSVDDMNELLSSCDFLMSDGVTPIPSSERNKMVSVNGFYGIYLRSRYNGRIIFIAAAGYGQRLVWSLTGVQGYLWLSTWGDEKSAGRLRMTTNGIVVDTDGERYRGFPIRPVYDPSLL